MMAISLLDRVRDDLVLPLLATASARCQPEEETALLLAPLVLLQMTPTAEAQVLVQMDVGPVTLGVFDGPDLPPAGLAAVAALLAAGVARLDADVQRDYRAVMSSGQADLVVSIRPDLAQVVVYVVARGDQTSPIEVCRLQGDTGMEIRH